MVGSGTLADPYRISSVADLQAVASDMNAGVYYVIDADIDLAGIEWTPLGDDITPFSCNIDGNGHTILNLTITASILDYVGLIGYAYQSIINKIVITGANVSSSTHIGSSIGCLVGYSLASVISDCEIDGAVDGSDSSLEVGIIAGTIDGANYGIYRCKARGSIINGSYDVGGIVGFMSNSSDIIDCDSDVLITTTANRVGGIVGTMVSGNALRCTAFGNVNGYSEVGGFAGEFAGGNIQSCFAHGDVHEAADHYGGGFIGFANAISNMIILMCAADGDVDGIHGVGGFIGELTVKDDISATISRCYGSGDVTGYDGVGGFIGIVTLGSGGDI